jgi:hypothetical protein
MGRKLLKKTKSPRSGIVGFKEIGGVNDLRRNCPTSRRTHKSAQTNTTTDAVVMGLEHVGQQKHRQTIAEVN